MKTISTIAFVGPSGKPNQFRVGSEYTEVGVFAGINVKVLRHGDDRDLTKANLIDILIKQRARIVKNNTLILQRVNCAPLHETDRPASDKLSTDDVVLNFVDSGAQIRFKDNNESIETIDEYIRLLGEGTGLQFNIPSTQSKAMCVIS